MTGIGETILDIIFKNGQPVAAVPGGSSFNSIISIARAGVPCRFVGYTGADKVGEQTVRFMRDNNVDTVFFEVREDVKSAVSLAFLDDNADAHYVFYKQPPCVGDCCPLPPIAENDVLLYGSYYASCHGTRSLVTRMLRRAQEAGAIVYYDINFRKSHLHELESLTPAILENFDSSDVVRGSADDFEVMYGTRNAERIYAEHIKPHCPIFICTDGSEAVTVCTTHGCRQFVVPPVENVVSTVGAGDNFNAGFSCALIWNGITKKRLPSLSVSDWQMLTGTAASFAGEACKSTDNYIGKAFGEEMKTRH